MPPQNVDMSAIREAMLRRRQGGSMPVGGQMTAPTGPSAQGGYSTPVPGVGAPQASGRNLTPGQSPSGSLGRSGGSAPANVDEETRNISKALVRKLIQFL